MSSRNIANLICSSKNSWHRNVTLLRTVLHYYADSDYHFDGYVSSNDVMSSVVTDRIVMQSLTGDVQCFKMQNIGSLSPLYCAL